VIGGLTRGSGRAELARAALEGIAWRVADVLAVVGAAELRVDGGLTRSDTLLQLQADFAGVTVRRTSPDATVRGAAALAAVGAGLLPDTAAIAALTPAGPAIEPQTDAPWRQEAHAAWRRFVQASSSGG
jgi:glycerol kinase